MKTGREIELAIGKRRPDKEKQALQLLRQDVEHLAQNLFKLQEKLFDIAEGK